MFVYNKVNGVFVSFYCELFIDVLKGEWGFDGVVVSDWGVVFEMVENVVGGLDLEMFGLVWMFGEKLFRVVEEGWVFEVIIFDKVKWFLMVVVCMGKFDVDDVFFEFELVIDKFVY